MTNYSAPQRRGQPRQLRQLWRNRWLAIAVTTCIALLVGFTIVRALPRGPMTVSQALTVMLAGFAVGWMAGFVMKSSWAMAIAPIAYIAAIELGQLSTVGPTVGPIRLDSTFGILALMVGRGFHGLVVLFAMLLGVGIGMKLNRPILMTTLAVITIILAIFIAWPASTPTIVAADGQPVPGSIASLEKVQIGGHDQWTMLRGQSVEKPVLLYLSGGPGQSDLSYLRVLFEDLTRDFVVVSWDQRGTGKSYAAIDPTETLTLEQTIADTAELSDYLRDRFQEKKIYLLGESWGSLLGVLTVQ